MNKQKEMNHFVKEAIKNMNKSSNKKQKDFQDNILETQEYSDRYIRWFSELSNRDIKIVGGKGASLSEMFNAKFPVPPGFAITTHAFEFFMANNALNETIQELIQSVNTEETEQLQNTSKKIRTLIEEQEIPKELEKEIIEAYHILSAEKINKIGVSENALNILKNAQEPLFVSVRSSATTEDLVTASFAGQQESFLNIKGDRNLLEHVKKCFSSLYTARAIYYRNKKGFKESETLLSVIIQKMVDSEKSGVIFSKDPANKTEDIVIESVYGLGEGIVSGTISPDYYAVTRDLKIKNIKLSEKKIAIVRNSSGKNEAVKLSYEKSKSQVLTNGEILEAADYALKLENHYKKPQDIEFAIENKKLYIIQSRPITTLKQIKPGEKTQEISGNIILEGLGSSPGIGAGIVKIIQSMNDLSKIKKGDILVTEMTNPDMVVAMEKSTAIITNEGGTTSHASIVSREIGIPCVVGTGNATSVLRDGMRITVDGSTGKIYEGEIAKTTAAEIKPALETNRIKLKLIVDLPDFAKRAAESKIDTIGLTRIEGMIASMGKHPLLYEKENKLEEYTEILEKGIEKILELFKQMWIRTSDIRTDEYNSLKGAPEKEINPMLGMHGIRFSLKHPKIFEAELRAIQRVAEKNPDKKLGIMFPQIISIEEIQKAKKYFNKFKTPNMQFGVMIETPAAVQIIEDICRQGIDFISFGTNDLTQFTLGVDRGEDEVQHLYDELHPAIISQIKRVINVCRREKIETSICGQAGSKKEMVKILFQKGISSISVNADAAYDISKLIQELEQEREKEFQEKQSQIKDKPLNQPYKNQSFKNNPQSNNTFHKKYKDKYKHKRWDKRAEVSFNNQHQQGQKKETIMPELPEKETFLNKNKIKIYAEPDEKFSEQEITGDLERVEEKIKQIQQEVKIEREQELKKEQKIEDNIQVTESPVEESEDLRDSDDSEDIGVYKPEQKSTKEKYNYNFDGFEDFG